MREGMCICVDGKVCFLKVSILYSLYLARYKILGFSSFVSLRYYFVALQNVLLLHINLLQCNLLFLSKIVFPPW